MITLISPELMLLFSIRPLNFTLNRTRLLSQQFKKNIKISVAGRIKVSSEIIDQIFPAILRLIAKNLTFTF